MKKYKIKVTETESGNNHSFIETKPTLKAAREYVRFVNEGKREGRNFLKVEIVK